MATLGDPQRRIRDCSDTPEAAWRVSLAHEAMPALPLPAAGCRLVVVAPHPDDEVLGCGGLLAMHARRGGRALIVAVTDGEASHRGDAAWPPARLAAARRRERERGLAALGMGDAELLSLGFADGEVAANGALLQRALRDALRPGDHLVTTWREDGHPDHEATGARAVAAAAEAGCTLIEAPVWMWQWSAPGDPRVPWPRLRALPLPPFAQAAKARALAEHATQLAPRAGGRAPVLGEAVRARAGRGCEYFILP